MSLWDHNAGNAAGNAAGNTAVDFGDSPSIDAFARQRVSAPFTLFDSKQIWDDPDIANTAENFPLFFDNQEESGGGTATAFDVDRASTTLSVSATTAGKRTRQSKQRFNYQPGKSMLIILTGKAGDTGAGITKELGYFDDNNGAFYRDDGGAWSVVIRSFVSGAAVDTAIAQANWNLDPMDGTGPSGILLDRLAVQILFLDFEWLGVGRVRFGFFVDGLPVYCHQVLNSNVITSVYMSTPNLPIRASIENDGAGAADSVEQICATVISEGGVQPNGVFRAADLGALAASAIQAGSVDSAYAVCGIRLKAAYLSAQVDIIGFSAAEVSSATDPFLWRLHLNPTLTTGLTYTDQAQSAVQFGAGLPAGDVLTDLGYVIANGYVTGEISSTRVNINSAIRPGSLIDGTSDEFILSMTPLSANQDYLGSLIWREVW